MTLAIDTVGELEQAIIAFSEGKRSEVIASINRLFEEEVEIDELRRAVLEELTKGSLPTKYREDLRGLVERLDEMADHVKDSARSLKVLMEAKFPEEIMDEYVTIGRALRKEAIALGECIKMLGVDPSKVKETAKNVDFFEAEIDERYVWVKTLLVKYSKELDAPVLMALWDLVDFMERAADVCVHTADYLRTLAAAETASE